MRAAVLCLVSASVAIATTGQGAAPHDSWKTYTNVRFGYQVCYPPHLLKPQGEADNGDGQVFRSRDGAELRVFGSNNALELSLAQEAKAQARAAMGPNGRINYIRTGIHWNVTSGQDRIAHVFYHKTFQRADQFVSFQIKYPRTQAARYEPVIERISRCFVLLKPAF